jgi:hypothetical protein
LQKTSENPEKSVKGPHLGVRKVKVLPDGRQERGDDPTKPIVSSMG